MRLHYCLAVQRAVAVIPARSGSQRLPGKNVKEFLGVPSIARAIDTVRRAGIFEEIIVSTDDPSIAEIAQDHGAIVPALRPASLADDYTPTRPVIIHAIQEWIDGSVEIVACVYAVTPLLRPELLREAVDQAVLCDGYVFPVEESRYPIQRAIELDNEGRSFSREPESFFARSQDLAPTFFDVGQFYVASREVWLKRERFHEGGTAIVVEAGSLVDIDTWADWDEAERRYLSSARSGDIEAG